MRWFSSEARSRRAAARACLGVSATVLIAALSLSAVAGAPPSGATSTGGWSLAPAPTAGEAPLPSANASGSAPAANPRVSINDVSCTSASYCVAVGSYADAGGVSQTDGLLEVYSAGTWTATAAPEPSTNASGVGPGTDAQGHQSASLAEVTCPAQGSCLAVGSYKDAGGFVWGLIEVLSGGTWTATAAPEPSTDGFATGPGTDTNLKQAAALNAITCTSASSCVAVGNYDDSDGNQFGLIEALSGGTWTATAAPQPATDPVVAGSADSVTGQGTASLRDVSCPASGSCVAVGSYKDADGNVVGLIDSLSGGAWTATAAPEPASNPLGTGPGYSVTGAGAAELHAVSCPATGSCVAVGQYNDSNLAIYGLIDSLSGGTWTASAAPEPATNSAGATPGNDSAGHGFGTLSALTCSSASSCVAVGQYSDVSGFRYGLIDSLSGSSWSSLAAPEPASAGTDADSHAGATLNDLSCAQPGSCAAVGSFKDSAGFTFGLAENLAGGVWSASALPEPANAGSDAGGQQSAAAGAVSCSSDGACLSVGTYADSSGAAQGLVDAYVPLAPTVHAISPRLGIDGRKVTIAGADFYPGATVSFGPVPATSVTYLSPTLIQAIAPPFHGSVYITVTDAGGTSGQTSGNHFTYESPVSVSSRAIPVGTSGVLFTWACQPYTPCHARAWLHAVAEPLHGGAPLRGVIALRKFSLGKGKRKAIQLRQTGFGALVLTHRRAFRSVSFQLVMVTPGNVRTVLQVALV